MRNDDSKWQIVIKDRQAAYRKRRARRPARHLRTPDQGRNRRIQVRPRRYGQAKLKLRASVVEKGAGRTSKLHS